MKVALVKCPWWVRYCPPYILAFFATYLRGQGHEVSCFDLNNSLYHESGPGYRRYWDDRDYYSLWENPSFVEQLLGDLRFDAVADRILASGARVVAFDTHTPSVLISLELARRVKERDPGCVTVFMGHKAARAQMAFDFAKSPYVDYVCPGEAERALSDLLALLESGPSEPPACPGFLMLRDGEVVDCGPAAPAGDLDALPIPDYRDFADDIRGGRYSQPDRLDILDSRGCVNACRYCYERLFWPGYRTMSGARIFEQVSAHAAAFPQVRTFYFNGLLLNGSPAVIEEFCDRVLGSGLDITWSGQAMIRPDMTAGLLGKMRRAGCTWLGYGVESGSRRVRETMNKRYTTADALRVLKDTKEAGIATQINVMFGLPTETDGDFKDTLAFLVRARPYIDSVLASQSFFTLEKETYVFRHAEEFGITGKEHHLFWKSNGGANDYAERFRRYEEFCRLALRLGLPETSGVLAVKPDKWYLLGEYHMYEKDYGRAVECFERSLRDESANATVYRLLGEAYRALNRHGDAEECLRRAREGGADEDVPGGTPGEGGR